MMNQRSKALIGTVQLLLHRLDFMFQLCLLLLRRIIAFVQLVHGQSNYDTVEEPLIKCFHSLLQQNFFLELGQLLLMCCFDDFMVEPMLENMVSSAQANEQPAEGFQLALLLFLLHERQHRLGEGSYAERKYFLKRNHRALIIIISRVWEQSQATREIGNQHKQNALSLALQSKQSYQSIMLQSKDFLLELNCAVCCSEFSGSRPPLIFCRNAHLCCQQCLEQKSNGYEYASFLCPLCLHLACRATAVKCDWLLPLLASASAKERSGRIERLQLIRQNELLKEEVESKNTKLITIRNQLGELQKWRNSFLSSCRIAYETTISKKFLDGKRFEQQIQNFERCPQIFITEFNKLQDENKKLFSVLDKLKKENSIMKSKIENLKSEKDTLQLNWSGTYTKPTFSSKIRHESQGKEEEETHPASVCKEPEQKALKTDCYFVSNMIDIFKQKIRNSEQQASFDKRSQSKNRTYKKYLNKKIEFDEKLLEVNPKFNRLNSNLKKLRDAFETTCTAKKKVV